MRTRWGRRHPLMVAGGTPTAILFLALFQPPEGLVEIQLFAWMLLVSILLRIFLTIYFIPYAAMGAELSTDYDERKEGVIYAASAFVGKATTGAGALLAGWQSTCLVFLQVTRWAQFLIIYCNHWAGLPWHSLPDSLWWRSSLTPVCALVAQTMSV